MAYHCCSRGFLAHRQLISKLKKFESDHVALNRRSLSLSVCRRFFWREDDKPKDATGLDAIDRGMDSKKEIKAVVTAGSVFKQPMKSKDAFLDIIDEFSGGGRYKKRQGQVEFIHAALKHMKEYGVHRDIETYKCLLDIFPKERMKPRNSFQVHGMHYAKFQYCALDVLNKMEENNIIPDGDLERLVISIFSKYSLVWRKIARQIYWFSKFKNANPFPMPEVLPDDAMELAKVAMKRMCPDIQTRIQVFDTSNIDQSIDKTWIVSAQCPTQKEIITKLGDEETLYVQGSFRSYLRTSSISYFVLRTAPPKIKRHEHEDEDYDPDVDLFDVYDMPLDIYGGTSVKYAVAERKILHEQDDGTVLALCASGTSSRDSILSWVRILEYFNPRMRNLQVIFTPKAPEVQVATMNEKLGETKETENREEHSFSQGV